MGRFRLSHRLAGDGRGLPAEAEHAEQVRAVRPGRDVEDDVAQLLDQRPPYWRIGAQHEDALVVVTQPELLLAQDHARRFHAANRAQLELRLLARVAIDQLGALGGEGDLLTDRHVRRTADDLLFAGAGVHRHQPEPVRVGVRLHRQYLGHPNPLGVPVRPDGLPALNLSRSVDQPAGQLGHREIDVHELTKPVQ